MCDSEIQSVISRKPGIEMGLSRKDVWKVLLFKGMNKTITYTKDPTKLLRRFCQEKLSGWPERDRYDNTERRVLDSQNSTSRKQVDKIASCKHMLPFKKKEEPLKGWSHGCRRLPGCVTKDYSQAFKPSKICP